MGRARGPDAQRRDRWCRQAVLVDRPPPGLYEHSLPNPRHGHRPSGCKHPTPYGPKRMSKEWAFLLVFFSDPTNPPRGQNSDANRWQPGTSGWVMPYDLPRGPGMGTRGERYDTVAAHKKKQYLRISAAKLYFEEIIVLAKKL